MKGKKQTRIARIMRDGKPTYVIVEWNDIFEMKGDLFGKFEKGEKLGKLRYKDLLAPVAPNRIYGLMQNTNLYKITGVAIGKLKMDEPALFTKPTASAVGISECVKIPRKYFDSGVKGSGELGVVLSKNCHNVTPEEAKDYVLGYMNTFDVIPSVTYYLEYEEKAAVKGFPTFCPMGPYLVTEGFDPDDGYLQQTWYNDMMMQSGKTDDYIWDVPHAISRISQLYEMKAGDVILMGAQSSSQEVKEYDKAVEGGNEFANGTMLEGDMLVVETEGLGRLIMTVHEE